MLNMFDVSSQALENSPTECAVCSQNKGEILYRSFGYREFHSNVTMRFRYRCDCYDTGVTTSKLAGGSDVMHSFYNRDRFVIDCGRWRNDVVVFGCLGVTGGFMSTIK